MFKTVVNYGGFLKNIYIYMEQHSFVACTQCYCDVSSKLFFGSLTCSEKIPHSCGVFDCVSANLSIL